MLTDAPLAEAARADPAATASPEAQAGSGGKPSVDAQQRRSSRRRRGRSGDGKPRRDGAPAGRGAAGGGFRPGSRRPSRRRRDDRRVGTLVAWRTSAAARRPTRPWPRPRGPHDGPEGLRRPPIPEEVTAAELDKHAMRALQGLPEKLADRVARHLVMTRTAGRRGPENRLPARTRPRARRAQRVALVREAVGEVRLRGRQVLRGAR